jgi:hypothetical protein
VAERKAQLATVKAYPRKQFFLDMFIRDISLEDSILDLIDNSIDSLLRVQNADIERLVLTPSRTLPLRPSNRPARIKIAYSRHRFVIEDNCGGIPKKAALEDVFCFGHADGHTGKLGVYGIGLKRAIFKLGNHIEVESRTEDDGFRVPINVTQWANKDTDVAEDWVFDIFDLPPAKKSSDAGTRITVTQLRPEVVERLNDGTLDATLRRTVSQAYSIFLTSNVDVIINERPVQPVRLPSGSSSDFTPGTDTFTYDDVRVNLLATLAPEKEWQQSNAGWYVLCNGRTVVNADKGELTGWGAGLPAFHSKYRGFFGLALFTSDNPMLLPWTTTKRGLNREAMVYQMARNRMKTLSRPVIRFLDRMYPSDPLEAASEREIAKNVLPADFRDQLKPLGSITFQVKQRLRVKDSVRVQYEAPLESIERVRARLRKPSMSASAVGLHALQHFVTTECPD